MKKLTIMALLSLLGLFSCKGYKDLSVEAFHSKLSTDGTIQLLDVRTPQEYAEGHIPGSRNLPLSALEAGTGDLDADAPLYVYCLSGGRSSRATAALRAKGFNAKNIGGISAWKGEIEK